MAQYFFQEPSYFLSNSSPCLSACFGITAHTADMAFRLTFLTLFLRGAGLSGQSTQVSLLLLELRSGQRVGIPKIIFSCSHSFLLLLYRCLLVVPTAAAKSRQSCPTLCDPIDGSPPGSPIPGILQARTLEWVAISFSSA